MRTKSISIFYGVNKDGLENPEPRELERRDRWIKGLQEMSEENRVFMKVTYEIHNPDVGRQIRFFNGTVVKYYCIQNENMTEGLPSNELLKTYRETLLDELLGYDVSLVFGTARRRKSTSDFKSVRKWNEFLNLCEETIFENAGFEFPVSEEFWDLVEKWGFEEAERISIQGLQTRIKRKLDSIKDI